MSVRPPRNLARRNADNPLAALQHEMLQEKAAALSRLGRRLEAALQRLAAGADDGGERERLLAEAGEALWHFVVQREAMGLGGTEQALSAYGVPTAVRARMGILPRCRAPTGARQRQ